MSMELGPIKDRDGAELEISASQMRNCVEISITASESVSVTLDEAETNRFIDLLMMARWHAWEGYEPLER